MNDEIWNLLTKYLPSINNIQLIIRGKHHTRYQVVPRSVATVNIITVFLQNMFLSHINIYLYKKIRVLIPWFLLLEWLLHPHWNSRVIPLCTHDSSNVGSNKLWTLVKKLRLEIFQTITFHIYCMYLHMLWGPIWTHIQRTRDKDVGLHIPCSIHDL